MRDLHYFISDVTSYPVTFTEQDDGRQLAQGIPIIRPGKYHGTTYTVDDLKQMAENFDTIRDRDGFTPSLTPKHWAEVDEALGPITAVRFDEERSGLVADALVSQDTVSKIQTGKYRYISGEIDFDYELQTEGKESIGPALEGAAFVLSPAVRGMQIDAVLNAHEFPQLFIETDDSYAEEWANEARMYRMNKDLADDIIEQLTSLIQGGDNMSLKDKVMALLGRARKGEEVTEDEVVALTAEVETKDTEEEVDDKATIDLDQLNRQLDEERKARAESDERIVALETARMRDKCQLQVDELVRGGHVPPAQRQEVYLMLEKLSGDESKLIVLGKDAEGEETTDERTPVEVYVNTLKGMGLKELTPEHLSGGFFNEEVLDKASEEAAVAVGERIVKAIPPDQRKETEKTD